MNDVVVTYFGEQVSVPKEIADFLEQDQKRAQAQDKQDQRHLSKSEFKTVLSRHAPPQRTLENTSSSLKICERPSRNWTARTNS